MHTAHSLQFFLHDSVEPQIEKLCNTQIRSSSSKKILFLFRVLESNWFICRKYSLPSHPHPISSSFPLPTNQKTITMAINLGKERKGSKKKKKEQTKDTSHWIFLIMEYTT